MQLKAIWPHFCIQFHAPAQFHWSNRERGVLSTAGRVLIGHLPLAEANNRGLRQTMTKQWLWNDRIFRLFRSKPTHTRNYVTFNPPPPHLLFYTDALFSARLNKIPSLSCFGDEQLVPFYASTFIWCYLFFATGKRETNCRLFFPVD
jgi:hypothetical protein